MVMCGMIGCSKRSGRDRVSFYRLPGTQRASDPAKKDLQLLRRSVWLTRICREDIINDEKKLKHFRVCNRHFIRNAPAALKDINDPDWAPSLLLGHNYYQQETDSNGERLKNEIENILYEPSLRKKWHPLLKQKKYYEEVTQEEGFDIIEWRSSLKKKKLKTGGQEVGKDSSKEDSDSPVTIIYLRWYQQTNLHGVYVEKGRKVMRFCEVYEHLKKVEGFQKKKCISLFLSRKNFMHHKIKMLGQYFFLQDFFQKNELIN